MREMTDGAWDVSGDVPVLVEFCAKFCGPCRKMEADLAELEAEWAGRVDMRLADMGKCQGAMSVLGIRSFPTFVMYVGGKEAGRWIGALEKRVLKVEVETRLPAA